MVWSWYIIAAALVLAAGCSFFFALAESALFALGRFRARQLLEENPPVGRRIAPLFERPEDLVATLALGNTVANGAIIGLTVWILTHTFLPQFMTALAALVLI